MGLHNSGAWKLDSGITKGRSYVKLSSLRFVTFRGTHFRDFAVWGVSWWKARVVCFMAGWDLGLGGMALALSGLWAVGGGGGFWAVPKNESTVRALLVFRGLSCW